MKVSFAALWGYATGWLVGAFLWHPVFGGDLSADLGEATAIMFFIFAVWCMEKVCRKIEAKP